MGGARTRPLCAYCTTKFTLRLGATRALTTDLPHPLSARPFFSV